MEKLEAAIEAILFSAGDSVETGRIAKAIGQDKNTTEKIIRNMMLKYNARDRGKDETSENADYISNLKSPFFLIEKSGKTKRTECERIVKQHLWDRVENRFCYKLNQTICNSCHDADIRAIPVCDQNDKKHGK